jgi:hypothetical protein
MAAPTWATDALGTALHLLGKSGYTLTRLNQISKNYGRTLQATTIKAATPFTHNSTTLTVTSVTGLPTTYPWFAHLVYTPAAHTHWAADTVTAVGDLVIPSDAAITATPALANYIFECTARAGDFKTHAATEPTWVTTTPGTSTTTDDQVTWTCYRRGVDEVVKVTGAVGDALTVVRNARGVPSAGGALVGAKGGADLPFPPATVVNALGTVYALTAGNALGTVTLATSAATDDIIDTAADHNMVAGQRVVFTALTGGTGLSTNVPYWVVATSLGARTFRVATTRGGTAIGFSADITAGTIQPWGYYTTADAATLGAALNKYFGISKVYGTRVFEIASRYAKRTLTLTVTE